MSESNAVSEASASPVPQPCRVAVMQASNLNMPNFNVNRPDEWPFWLKRFRNMMKAAQITDPGIQEANLLHVAGPEVFELHESLPAEEGGSNVFENTAKQLSDYFVPKKNVDYECDKFRHAKQNAGELITAYVARLRKLASTC